MIFKLITNTDIHYKNRIASLHGFVSRHSILALKYLLIELLDNNWQNMISNLTHLTQIKIPFYISLKT